ncbi:AAA family ATPase [Roseicyclus sp. F158]|uniref:Chromosome partition protein Smc n=1 Tax=Tropicimonas omnivorans TaxID=3075590 RepID=A0ABU3DDT6_9RHOB|nr:AAA family ATPase [Roseicyclus sp. F158]MDT0681871.1 AAA family ATPase [Roseicyclus sp. F158]
MRFTRLRLNGFKSFVDPTDLVIADGLTGVVGPNGCGKSNLLEALRWVMGENRPTAMRGGGMEDVIFAGAATRGARNFAEVSLHIDNTERLAPSGFNEADELDIVRRITRDAGSAYKAAGRDVRARDVQMLFADASTGSHSPALVRQGQISELINARPKARRRILEEAAGISGLYQRRHEAELKLSGAEQNLSRVDDVIEQLASQLSTLARQARQAARYRSIGGDLRRAEGLLLFRRWREAADAAARAAEELTLQRQDAAAAETAVTASEDERRRAAESLPPLREEETVAAAVLQRILVDLGSADEDAARALRAIETFEGRLEQLARDLAREEELNSDAGASLHRLEDEKDRLAKAMDGHGPRLDAAQEAARIASENLGARESELAEVTEDVARLSAQHQSAERYAAEARASAERHRRERASSEREAAEARGKLDALGEGVSAATVALSEAQKAAGEAEDRIAVSDAALAECSVKEGEARAARSGAEGEVQALSAEATALERLVSRKDGEAAALIDSVTVAPGFEAAFGAALADELRAPVLDAAGTGWRGLPGYPSPQPLPAGSDPLSAHVEAPALLARRLAQIGLVEDAETGTRMQADLAPGQRLVTLAGDLFRWDGYGALSADAPSAAAIRLQQVNRLRSLTAELETLTSRAEDLAATHEALQSEHTRLAEDDKLARRARREADARVADASRAASRAENERAMAATRLEAAELAVERHTEELAASEARLEEAEATLAGLPDLGAAREGIADARHRVEGSRRDMLSARQEADELRRAGEGRRRRAEAVEREMADWSKRLRNAEASRADLARRREETERDLAAARPAPQQIAERRATLETDREKAEARRTAAAEALAAAESAHREAELAAREAERAASEARERRAAADARAEAARASEAEAAERIREALDVEPDALLDRLGGDADAIPPAPEIEAEIDRLRRSRDALGAVNLRAEEDSRAVQEEHDELVTEKADLEDAIGTLRTGIASLNKEGRERLLAAFEEVNGNFSMLFKHLFGGGEAKLMLVESDDPLDAGLEIMCMPPGKKLSVLSLLSGGEQTLTAMALIFAVFLANPAPICVLDEVDAPLDDANVTRFCDLLEEMTRQTDTRFLIITHHAITMSRMDRLFGVTMQEQGVSQLVSVDLKKAEAMVA